MAQLKIDPRFVETVKTTAGARAALAVSQRLGSKDVKRIQQVLQAVDFASGVFGLDNNEDRPQPLLGGVTLRKARELYAQMARVSFARKNLWFVRIEDTNPPPGALPDGHAGPFLNLFALDVSYTTAVQGEKVPLGAGFFDRPTGREAVEVQITTMDDSRGTLKRWFEGKMRQFAHDDGTFGLPDEYLVGVEVVHAVPLEATEEAHGRAYRFFARMRPQAIQHELSRRDQALAELPMTFSEFDSFLGRRGG